jgi:hypothetical protein
MKYRTFSIHSYGVESQKKLNKMLLLENICPKSVEM